MPRVPTRYFFVGVTWKRQDVTRGPPHLLWQSWPPASRAELLLGSALIAFSLLGTAYVLKGRFDALALERDAVAVQGKVLQLWVTRGKGGRAFHVQYEFRAATDDGTRVVKHESTLPEKYFDRLRVGEAIAVTYCRTSPANHLIEGGTPPPLADGRAVAAALGTLAMLAAAGAINLSAWWATRRRAAAT